MQTVTKIFGEFETAALLTFSVHSDGRAVYAFSQLLYPLLPTTLVVWGSRDGRAVYAFSQLLYPLLQPP